MGFLVIFLLLHPPLPDVVDNQQIRKFVLTDGPKLLNVLAFS